MSAFFYFESLYFVVLYGHSGKSKFLKLIGEQVKQAREKKGVSAAELALKTGTERSTVARLEGGRTNPTTVTLKLICDALEISFVELFQDLKISFDKQLKLSKELTSITT